jgi:hypothetical protein
MLAIFRRRIDRTCDLNGGVVRRKGIDSRMTSNVSCMGKE